MCDQTPTGLEDTGRRHSSRRKTLPNRPTNYNDPQASENESHAAGFLMSSQSPVDQHQVPACPQPALRPVSQQGSTQAGPNNRTSSQPTPANGRGQPTGYNSSSNGLSKPNSQLPYPIEGSFGSCSQSINRSPPASTNIKPAARNILQNQPASADGYSLYTSSTGSNLPPTTATSRPSSQLHSAPAETRPNAQCPQSTPAASNSQSRPGSQPQPAPTDRSLAQCPQSTPAASNSQSRPGSQPQPAPTDRSLAQCPQSTPAASNSQSRPGSQPQPAPTDRSLAQCPQSTPAASNSQSRPGSQPQPAPTDRSLAQCPQSTPAASNSQSRPGSQPQPAPTDRSLAQRLQSIPASPNPPSRQCRPDLSLVKISYAKCPQSSPATSRNTQTSHVSLQFQSTPYAGCGQLSQSTSAATTSPSTVTSSPNSQPPCYPTDWLYAQSALTPASNLPSSPCLQTLPIPTFKSNVRSTPAVSTTQSSRTPSDIPTEAHPTNKSCAQRQHPATSNNSQTSEVSSRLQSTPSNSYDQYSLRTAASIPSGMNCSQHPAGSAVSKPQWPQSTPAASNPPSSRLSQLDSPTQPERSYVQCPQFVPLPFSDNCDSQASQMSSPFLSTPNNAYGQCSQHSSESSNPPSTDGTCSQSKPVPADRSYASQCSQFKRAPSSPPYSNISQPDSPTQSTPTPAGRSYDQCPQPVPVVSNPPSQPCSQSQPVPATNRSSASQCSQSMPSASNNPESPRNSSQSQCSQPTPASTIPQPISGTPQLCRQTQPNPFSHWPQSVDSQTVSSPPQPRQLQQQQQQQQQPQCPDGKPQPMTEKLVVEYLVDRLAQVCAENALLMRRVRTLRRKKMVQSDGASGPGGVISHPCGTKPALLSRCDVEEPSMTKYHSVVVGLAVEENCNTEEQQQSSMNSGKCDQHGRANGRPISLLDATSCRPPSMDSDQLNGEDAARKRPSIRDRSQPSSLGCPSIPTKKQKCGEVPPQTSDCSETAGVDPDGGGARTRCKGTTDDGCLDGLVFVVGEALLDVCAEVDQLFLTKYGLNVDDVIRARPEHANLLADMQANWRCHTSPGGSSQNTARVLQWVLGVRRAISVFGCIGADKNGEQLANYMKKSGVHLRYAIDDRQPTGICSVCMVGPHRSIVTNIGAGGLLSLDHLRDPGTRRLMQRANLFYLESYGLSNSSDVLREVADYATQHNVTLALNLSARFICTQYVESLRQLIEHADIVFGNRCEAFSFAFASRLPADGILEIARLMCALPKKNGNRGRVVVITDGSEPTVVAEKGLVDRYPVPVLSFSEKLVDAIGAGDAFVGGFLAGFLVGADMVRCVEMGHICSRFVIGRRACDIPSDKPPPVTVDRATLMQLKRPTIPGCT